MPASFLLLSALSLAAAQPVPSPATPPDVAAEAVAMIESHRINKRLGCPIPMPATWNAPQWEQQAAWQRRRAFEDCLSNAMAREQERLAELTDRVDRIRTDVPAADWSRVDLALDAKWSELESLETKLNIRAGWADTAVNILDTFTGPGAPFDTSRSQNPYGAYRPGYYRPNSSYTVRGVP